MERKQGLLAWQWSMYPAAHRDRRNLVIHLFTMPLFVAGLFAVPLGIARHLWLTSGLGFAAMIFTVIAQGIGHKLEKQPPAKIEGPLDAARRIFAEQLFTFPRYLLTGKLLEAWMSPNERRKATPQDPAA